MTNGQLDLIDGYSLAEQANRRFTVADLANAARNECSRDNTRAAFKTDWAAWLAFCDCAVWTRARTGTPTCARKLIRWATERRTGPETRDPGGRIYSLPASGDNAMRGAL